MKTRHIIITIASALAITAAGPAWAVRVTDARVPTTSAMGQAPQPSAAASHADDSSSLREGTISDVSAKHDQIEVNGSWLKLVEGKTRVFREGRATSGDALAKGQKVKFTLAPGDAGRTTLGVVYVP
ncbi:MAG: hypothetical protein M3Y67_10500 [Pseudomonadota bacterium]|nr:hypothetical protein [Pseudomonadota bacterium]